MISPKYHIYLTGDFDFSTGFYRSPAVISTADAIGTDQILMRHIQVNYTLTAMIRCQISSKTVGQIETELSKINID